MSGNVWQTVARKRALEGPLESAEAEVRRQIGSKGWHTRGYLPHYDVPGLQQMLTFRLADAMPAERRREWEDLFRIKDERERRTRLEAYLDLGYGSCVLKERLAAEAVERVLLRYDGRRYRLLAWVVMPNHLHVLVELWTVPLGALLRAWKGASSNALNRLLGWRGQLWQEDYWDRYMRDETHFRKAVRYIESNPIKAGLAHAAADWPFGSANPKWTWSGADRYYGAQLVWSERVQSCPPAPERGHSCPQVSSVIPAPPFPLPPPKQCYTSAGLPFPVTTPPTGPAA